MVLKATDNDRRHLALCQSFVGLDLAFADQSSSLERRKSDDNSDMLDSRDCNLFLHRPTAMCTSLLKRMGITHVLNAAQGKEKNCGLVNTWPGFYTQSGIQFLGVPAFDNIVFRIHPYFEEAATFIDEALKSGGKVLVHCQAGISRSATLVCAFLMLKRGFTAQEAVKSVRKNRAIIPNDGFLRQLCDLNDKLNRKIVSDDI
ncbi:dual specificity protein phosphatase 3 [Trichonephila clavipes]|nr:dual specificity protein phosphatase 3 [Trichonephila clavipes]